MLNLVNMTPHPINIVNEDECVLTIPASGDLIRLSATTEWVADVDVNGVDVPLTRTIFGDPVGLPDRKVGTMYVVSQLVKSACVDRDDLLVPAEVKRDDKGQIVGCLSLGW